MTETGDLLVAVPRLVSQMVRDGRWSGEAFAGTALDLPEESRWRDIVTGAVYEGGPVDLGQLFGRLPYAVLRRTG
jgi:(1->4)-alpha-D-glucan 1-alpha-D-glucosylmutase